MGAIFFRSPSHPARSLTHFCRARSESSKQLTGKNATRFAGSRSGSLKNIAHPVPHSLYDYKLPSHLLATEPASPRDASKLMIYDTRSDTVTIDRFHRLSQYLPENSFLVLNQSAVAPARVRLQREHGGSVTVLFLVNEPREHGVIRGMVDRKLLVGEKVFIDPHHTFTVVAQEANIFSFYPDFLEGQIPRLLARYGTMPIPPYLKGSTLSEKERRKKYQTMFSASPLCHSERPRASLRVEGESRNPFLSSIAAPTASLHFTNRVFKLLDAKDIPHFFITLHVGRGTFAPVTEEQIQERRLHNEWYSVDPKTVEAIRQLKSQERKLVAVGTTTVRTLESSPVISTDPAREALRGSGEISHLNSTDLFIYPPYEFRAADILITNFHLPGSSLMMLVEAFLQHKKSPRHLIDLYRFAIKKNFRFYSFGDAILIL